MKPYGDKVLCTLVEKKSDSVIILSEKEKGSDLLVGRVVAVGQGLRATNGEVYPPDVYVDQQVMFFRNRAIEVDSLDREVEVEGTSDFGREAQTETQTFKAYLVSESELLAVV